MKGKNEESELNHFTNNPTCLCNTKHSFSIGKIRLSRTFLQIAFILV